MSTAAAGTPTSVTITSVIADPALHVVRTLASANPKGTAAEGVQFTDDGPNGNLSQYRGTIN